MRKIFRIDHIGRPGQTSLLRVFRWDEAGETALYGDPKECRISEDLLNKDLAFYDVDTHETRPLSLSLSLSPR